MKLGLPKKGWLTFALNPDEVLSILGFLVINRVLERLKTGLAMAMAARTWWYIQLQALVCLVIQSCSQIATV